MLFDFIVWFYAEFYFILLHSIAHCYVPLLQRAGELPRSASSHFNIYDQVLHYLSTILNIQHLVKVFLIAIVSAVIFPIFYLETYSTHRMRNTPKHKLTQSISKTTWMLKHFTWPNGSCRIFWPVVKRVTNLLRSIEEVGGILCRLYNNANAKWWIFCEKKTTCSLKTIC